MTQVSNMFSFSLKDFESITFNGFNIELPESTLEIISQLALEVGSPSYIRTPIFARKENICKSMSLGSNDSFKKKKIRKNGKSMEIINDEDWESIRTFHATKIEQKEGIEAQIDLIRLALNKMTDNNYNEKCNSITEILDIIMTESTEGDILRVCNQIFDIASNNRFYSKLYADLLASLINKYDSMRSVFDMNFCTFLELFNHIESANADEDYDNFCRVNRNNENRRALSAFFVNLTAKNIISEDKLLDLFKKLIMQVYEFIKIENKKSEVDEIVENLCILYNKDLVEDCEDEIDGKCLNEIIQELSECKAKSWPSLSNKSIFKFMDILEVK